MVERKVIECDVCHRECTSAALKKLGVPNYDQFGRLCIRQIDACDGCRKEIQKVTKRLMDNLVGFIDKLGDMRSGGNFYSAQNKKEA